MYCDHMRRALNSSVALNILTKFIIWEIYPYHNFSMARNISSILKWTVMVYDSPYTPWDSSPRNGPFNALSVSHISSNAIFMWKWVPKPVYYGVPYDSRWMDLYPFADLMTSWTPCTVYPKKYAHGFCFAVLCCGYTLTDFPISIRLTSLALWQSNDCPSASKATLMNTDKYFMWINYER